jgi:membrane protein
MFTLFKDLFKDWHRYHIGQLSAAITYYTIFSLAPILVISIAIAGLFFGQRTAEREILHQVQNVLGEHGEIFVQDIIENTIQTRSNVLTPLIGVVVLIYAASGAFNALRGALNTIFEVTHTRKYRFRRFVQGRILAILMTFIIGGLLILSLLMSTFLNRLASVIDPMEFIPGMVLNVRLLNEIIAFIVVTLMFAMLYKFLPDSRARWGHVLQGAGFASLFYNLGKFLISYYLGVSRVDSVYGTAGDVMLLLLWIYYSVQILLMGAIYTKMRGENSSR